MKYCKGESLTTWIAENDLVGLRDDWIIHISQFLKKPEDVDDIVTLVKLLMISLRERVKE